MLKLPCVYAVILYGIGILEKLGILKTRHGMNHILLNFLRQRAGKTIRIYDRLIKIFRFKHDMMLNGARKPDYLVLNGRTIPHACTFNRTAIQGRIRQMRSDYIVSF